MFVRDVSVYGKVNSATRAETRIFATSVCACVCACKYIRKQTQAVGEGACVRASTHKHREHWSHTHRAIPVLHLATHACHAGNRRQDL